MTLYIPPGFAQIALELSHDSDPDPWYVTFGLDIEAVESDPEAVLDKIAAAWTSNLIDSTSTAVVLTAVRATVGLPDGDPLIISKNFNVRGTLGGDYLPQNCALLVSKNSALGGRKNRGRFFWPGMLKDADVSAVGVIASVTVTPLQTHFNAFLAQINAAGTSPVVPATPMVILHNAGVTLDGPTPVTSLTVKSTISTQRRRLR